MLFEAIFILLGAKKTTIANTSIKNTRYVLSTKLSISASNLALALPLSINTKQGFHRFFNTGRTSSKITWRNY
jgi:hypothetical protein